MVDHTLNSVISLSEDKLKELFSSLNGDENMEGTFYVKAGFDGSSSQSIYKQRYDDTKIEEGKKNEETLFQTGFVPLKLVICDKVMWSNPKPCSSNFCRPLHLKYEKESSNLCKIEELSIREQMKNLNSFKYQGTLSSGHKAEANITCNEDITMLDRKVINSLTDTLSTQSCNVCGAKPSEMNKLDVIRKKKSMKKLFS